ncbi:MAG: hypothetical protein ACKV2U_03850 [Bryobacteraceae bacterium]
MFRILLSTLFSTLPALFAQAEQVVSAEQGNFELQGRVRETPGKSPILLFRAKSGLGYRIQFSGPGAGRLDDPGRRPGVLASPLPETLATGKEIAFRLTANGPRIQLEWNGKPAWDYTEREAGVASTGSVLFQFAGRERLRDLRFRPLPATPLSFAERYGPAIGERAPAIGAVDQSGKPRDFASLRGPKGLWILFVRSADW